MENPEFTKEYIRMLDEAKSLVLGVKNVGYNGGPVQIRDYTARFPLLVAAYEIHKKALRLTSLTSPENPEGMELQESILDSCHDIINGAAFMGAEYRLRLQEGKIEQRQFKTVQEAEQVSEVGTERKWKP